MEKSVLGFLHKSIKTNALFFCDDGGGGDGGTDNFICTYRHTHTHTLKYSMHGLFDQYLCFHFVLHFFLDYYYCYHCENCFFFFCIRKNRFCFHLIRQSTTIHAIEILFHVSHCSSSFINIPSSADT